MRKLDEVSTRGDSVTSLLLRRKKDLSLFIRQTDETIKKVEGGATLDTMFQGI